MDNTEQPNSGEPFQWPFELFDPPAFVMPTRNVTKVIIDNTGWDSSAYTGVRLVDEINRWHRAEGWKGIKYHFVVDKQGNIVKGRDLEEVAIVSKDKMNGETILIAVQGLWHFTTIQMSSVDVLCSSIAAVCGVAQRPVTFHGMCEYLDVPSPMFDYGALLGLDNEGYYNKGSALVAELVAKEATKVEPLGAVA